MADHATACQFCNDVIVMVAVRCRHCGGVAPNHRSPCEAGPATIWRDQEDAWEATATLTGPRAVRGVPTVTPSDAPAVAAVVPTTPPLPTPHPSPRPVPVAPRVRTSTTYVYASPRGQGTRRALPNGARALPSAPRREPRRTRVTVAEPVEPPAGVTHGEQAHACAEASSHGGRPLAERLKDFLNRGFAGDLPPGTSVVVRNRFNEQWAPGFVVHEPTPDGYRIRRHHSSTVLPGIFSRDDVREASSACGTTRVQSSWRVEGRFARALL
jgi:hypothetical protein